MIINFWPFFLALYCDCRYIGCTEKGCNIRGEVCVVKYPILCSNGGKSMQEYETCVVIIKTHLKVVAKRTSFAAQWMNNVGTTWILHSRCNFGILLPLKPVYSRNSNYVLWRNISYHMVRQLLICGYISMTCRLAVIRPKN